MFRRHRHKSRSKRSRQQRWGIERLINSKLFILLGSMFIIIGLYNSLDLSTNTNSSNSFYDLISRFFMPSDDNFLVVPLSGRNDFLPLYFGPAVLILIFSSWFATKYSYYSYRFSLISALYLIVLQSNISFCFLNPWPYTNFFVASVYL